jgi:hypothetical protein
MEDVACAYFVEVSRRELPRSGFVQSARLSQASLAYEMDLYRQTAASVGVKYVRSGSERSTAG